MKLILYKFWTRIKKLKGQFSSYKSSEPNKLQLRADSKEYFDVFIIFSSSSEESQFELSCILKLFPLSTPEAFPISPLLSLQSYVTKEYDVSKDLLIPVAITRTHRNCACSYA